MRVKDVVLDFCQELKFGRLEATRSRGYTGKTRLRGLKMLYFIISARK
ncbi:hypothetical protein H6G32_10345 [Cylindrospermum sp. FACHB-282]|nr:hypothetical protein [Cylindrospermum sp. FACHB-282]